MKRSFINAKLREAISFLDAHDFHLPAWATWSPDRWKSAGQEAEEIRLRKLGWDVTDFGSGDYENTGLVLFTIRNGRMTDPPDPFVKNYCEKLLLIGENQVTPTHFHFSKMEDIINRAGGRLVLELWNADRETERLDETTDLDVSIDGMRRTVSPGEPITLSPGESITLPPYVYHRFHGEPAGGTVLGGEVSRVNDDARDNRFLHDLPRFPDIEEDVPPLHLLCTEYPPANS